MWCHYEAAPPWGVPGHGNQTANGDIVAVHCHCLFCEWRSLVSRCSQCNVVSLRINFIYCRNNSQSTTYPQTPVQTGWDQSFNHRKLMKTTLNRLTSVQSSFLRFVDLWGLVQVSVLSKFDKRLDWTGLPSTNQPGNTTWFCQLYSGCSNMCSLVANTNIYKKYHKTYK